MKISHKIMITTAAFMLVGASPIAFAETVTTKTVVTQKEIPNVKETNFSEFDVNKDNVYSMREVGEKLFYIFDTDGNEVIDNIEFTRKQIMTIIPMEKHTYIYTDKNDDGFAEEKEFNYETFIQYSGLMRFDENMDGLSPDDFVEKSFLSMDTDHSKAIELDEWKDAYIASLSPPVADQDRYN